MAFTQHISDIYSVLASSLVEHGFDIRSDQGKDYAIGVCCFSAKHTALIEGGYTITMAKRERIYNDPQSTTQKTKD
jgi:hypothetical protein